MANEMTKILQEDYEWRRSALHDPIESLSSDKLQYRREFNDETKRLIEKYGADWDRVFGEKNG